MSQSIESHTSINIREIIVPPVDLSDAQIIAQIKLGEINAYGSIMRRHNQLMFRIARSIVTDDAVALDVVQEAHIKAYFKLEEFRGKSQFSTWLATITRNEALMYLRKYKKEVSVSGDEMRCMKSSETAAGMNNQDNLPDEILANKQLQMLINQNVDQLPEDFRTVFVLRAIEHYSVKETSEILKIKEKTVRTRFFRAKRLLRKQIQRYLDSMGMKVYEFGGTHCDVVVKYVLEAIRKEKSRYLLVSGP